MAKSYKLIVPTIMETQLTGNMGAMEKTFRGHLYRVEFHRAGMAITKDGVKVRSWDDVPASIQRTAVSARDTLKDGLKKGGYVV